ncbi:MAG: hypothetical protein HOK06_09080 [Rhodospirillaceae bacterium]|jgi:hypothetical protein|nr:hypothetical protein [Rhodospirillaceae bacterium]MBT4464053.1 hypothetical protein [Rhodospirillaceae bacterium]MBT5014766.1 hypothetical protein [Rhodospirillaceae bacterium]MBT5309302.1 hypothetical protein [Rhodospirillaceae bacterium]MBT6407745.1 hypothetical protein [Rhodospirillaceae bacterium]
MVQNREKALKTAPDLLSGHMLNGTGGNNRWMTEIQCVLKSRADSANTAWLSHECRAEGVPFDDDSARGGGIFLSDKPWEFLVYRSGDKTWQMTTADLSIIDSDVAIEDMVPPTTDMTGASDSEVACAERAIREMTTDEALASLSDGSLSIRSTFMRIGWGGDDDGYDLYCPCRYINFPETGTPYIQPISGYVLFPVAGGQHMLAYVAAANDGDNTIVEFCCRRYRNIFAWAKSEIQDSEGTDAVLGNLEAQLPIIASTFDAMFKVDNGTLTLYTYE